MFLVGYALGQILCTQFWKDAYKPRNYVPWGITIGSYVCDWIILFTLRVYLQRENARRDRALAASGVEGGSDEKGRGPRQNKYDENFGYVEKVGSDGVVVRQKVEKALLDLTVGSLAYSTLPCLAHGETCVRRTARTLRSVMCFKHPLS